MDDRTTIIAVTGTGRAGTITIECSRNWQFLHKRTGPSTRDLEKFQRNDSCYGFHEPFPTLATSPRRPQLSACSVVAGGMGLACLAGFVFEPNTATRGIRIVLQYRGRTVYLDDDDN